MTGKTVMVTVAIAAAAYGIWWYTKNKAATAPVNTDAAAPAGASSNATGSSRTSECPAGWKPNAGGTRCVKTSGASAGRGGYGPGANMYHNYTY